MTGPTAAHDIPASEAGDTGEHATPVELLRLHEALEALAAGFPPGATGGGLV